MTKTHRFVELKAPFTAVYMTQVLIPKLWAQFDEMQSEVLSGMDRVNRMGVALRRSEVFHYIAGVEADRTLQVPARMVTVTVPTREYAVYTHAGVSGRNETDETYLYLLEKLRGQGLDHDPNAYSLEVFHADRKDELNIYIPLKV